MAEINTYFSIITLNVNGLTSPNKRQDGRMDLKKKISLYVVCSTHRQRKPQAESGKMEIYL